MPCLWWSFALAAAAAGCGGGGSAMPAGGDGGGGSGGGGGGDAAQDAAGDPRLPGSYEDPLVPRGTLPPGAGGVTHIQEMLARDDGTLFYCGSPGGLFTANVKDIARPVMIGRLQPMGRRKCQHLALDGTILWVTNRGDEDDPTPFVAAFDLSQSPPAPLTPYTEAGVTFEGIAAGGGRAYVALHNGGIAVLGRSGAALVRQGGLAAGFANAWAMALSGSTLHVGDAGRGLVAVDVSSPAAPRIVGAVDVSAGSPQSVVVAGAVAYLAAGAAGVVVVDVSDPTMPRVVATVDTPGSAQQVALGGGRLHVADWTDGRVFDLADPLRPKLVATERIPTARDFTRVLGVAALGDSVFLGEFAGAMHAYQFFPGRLAPDVWTATDSFTFRRTAAGGADAYALIVRNEGTAPLVVTSIEPQGAVLSVDRASLALDPGQGAAVEITFMPTAATPAPFAGSVVLRSDDPDEAPVTVALAANVMGLQVGDPAPAVDIGLLGGGNWRLSDQAGKVVVLSYFATF